MAEPLGYTNGSCDGCAAGLADMYQDYIDGKRDEEVQYVIMEDILQR